MKIEQSRIDEYNQGEVMSHLRQFEHLAETLRSQGVDVENILNNLEQMQIAIPSWALGTGGTRFGRFPEGGEPRNLEEKIGDIGLLHQLNRSSGAISLHIPWDIPENTAEIKALAKSLDIRFDAVNSNTFQDQPDQDLSFKFGSLSHYDREVRKLAIEHNQEVIRIGNELGSKSVTVWLADGHNFPGQRNFKRVYRNTVDSLQEIYSTLPSGWRLFLEYKPYEPQFYSTVIQDWGTSFLMVSELGPQAFCLVDLGHHLPNTNIEQIVSTLLMKNKLGGFHFNDSKYGDDDLTAGSIKPYQLFLIFQELRDGIEQDVPLAWMIDASHNVKDPLEDLLQSVEALKLAYAQAMLVDRETLEYAQENNDPVIAQEIIQGAFRTDVRPLLAESRRRLNGAINPVHCFRELQVRQQLVKERGKKTVATGL